MIAVGILAAVIYSLGELINLTQRQSKKMSHRADTEHIRNYMRERFDSTGCTNTNADIQTLPSPHACEWVSSDSAANEFLNVRDFRDAILISKTLTNPINSKGNMKFRASCPNISGQGRTIVIEYRFYQSDGEPAKDPITMLTYQWRDLFAGLSSGCGYIP